MCWYIFRIVFLPHIEEIRDFSGGEAFGERRREKERKSRRLGFSHLCALLTKFRRDGQKPQIN